MDKRLELLVTNAAAELATYYPCTVPRVNLIGLGGGDGVPHVAAARALTTMAELSTTVGGVLAPIVRRRGPRFMALSLGFAVRVVILVSFVELLPFPRAYGHEHLPIVGAVAGMAVMAVSLWLLS